MLVLTRRLNQSIKIGDDIEIMIIEVRGDQVRLGVTAPRDVVVHRKEVYLQIQQENQNAARETASNETVAAALTGLLAGRDAPNGSTNGANKVSQGDAVSLKEASPKPASAAANGSNGDKH